MKRRPASSTLLLLVLVFFISYLALKSAPYNHNHLLDMPKLHVEEAVAFGFLFFNQGEHAAATLLNQSTRMTVFNFVKDNPGFHFRALSSHLGMSVGVLQYHLGLLVNHGLISVYRDGRYRRYFESKKFSEAEMKTISILRHETSGRILVALMEKPQRTHVELKAQLNISSQALSWQMNRLEKMGFVQKNVDGLRAKYSLTETSRDAVNRFAALV